MNIEHVRSTYIFNTIYYLYVPVFQLPDLFDVCLPRPHLGEEGAGQGGEDGGIPARGLSLPTTTTNRPRVILLLL